MRSYRVVLFALLTPAMILAGVLALAFVAGAQAQTASPDVVRPSVAPADAPPTTQPTPEPAAATTPNAKSAADVVTTVPAVIKTNIPKSNVPRPTTKIAEGSCVTDKCHPGVKKFKVLHGPVNVDACEACHTLTSAKDHTFKLARGRTALCTFCHKVDLDGPVVHKPVKTGDCLPCHDPHGASNKQFLRGKTMNDLCSACHKNVIAGKSHVHGPAAAGACGACHQAHVAKYPNLLVAQGRDLCLGCHAEMKRQIDQAKIKHKAVEGDCLSCHDAHASNYPMQTLQPPVKLCTSKCHQKVKASALDSKYKHDPILAGDACLNCHTAHGGELSHLMRAKPVKICMKCHDKKQDAPDGRVIKPVPEVLDPVMIKHGPVRQGNCGGCHDVHGSNVSRLLAKPYSESFYEPFSLKEYALCFDCHNKELVLMPKTTTVTGFRNGATNLHYVHVHRDRMGRSCRACHSTHASTNAMHIRQSVPFGSWKLPVRFTPTKTGGSCVTGCHKKYTYDRVKALPIDKPRAVEPNKVKPARPATTMSAEEAASKAGKSVVPLSALADDASTQPAPTTQPASASAGDDEPASGPTTRPAPAAKAQAGPDSQSPRPDTPPTKNKESKP